jgi:hypothetical protein
MRGVLCSVVGLDLDQDWYPDGSRAPNYTLWREKWPKAFNVTNPLGDLERPLVKPTLA